MLIVIYVKNLLKAGNFYIPVIDVYFQNVSSNWKENFTRLDLEGCESFLYSFGFFLLC